MNLAGNIGAYDPVDFGRRAPAAADTPFVEIDHERMSRNIARMRDRAAAAGVGLRPHIKTHKSVELAREQIKAGAAGVTASKPSEALVFVNAGIRSITLAYPIVRSESIDRLLEAAAAHDAELLMIAADETSVVALADAALRHRAVLPVLMKVDVGLGRIGVSPESGAALCLADRIASERGLSFAGLLSHAGHSYAAKSSQDLERIALQEANDLGALGDRIRARGIDVSRISVGATPTCVGARLPPGITEIRPGNYVFFDVTALRLGICEPDDLAFSVVSRVVFRNERYVIVDAGSKTLSADHGPHSTGGSGFGLAISVEPGPASHVWKVDRLSEEHGFVPHEGAPLAVGTLLRIFPNHACATIAQFDHVQLSGSEGTRVLSVDARGCVT
jgi:D-serine deaminase-like pyridoxal phosphate-dependent protein